MIQRDTPVSNFELRIPTPEGFDFAHCLDYLGRSSEECLYEIHEQTVRKLLVINDRSVLLQVGSQGGRLLKAVVLHGGPLTAAEQQTVEAYIRNWFDLERDLGPFYILAEEDVMLNGIAKSFYGLRMVGIPDLFEALCWAVLGQQINLSFAYALKKNITYAYGNPLDWNGRRYYSFPSAKQLLATSPEELGAMKVSRAKSAALLEIAQRMESGELSRDQLIRLGDYDQMGEHLQRIKGIGPWTSHYVRMRCLGDPGAFPIGDAGLRNAVKLAAGLEEKPSEAFLQQLFEPWKGWEAYVTFYLWRTLY
ncbi:DNA-3-methyladenine glycosylase family protein [Paenibacillus physcomitrellae]|uniref:DNA-3-methyladenine glycosylase II n=1 Tax=Paenibacillus physcomitrellae TaxID=1619311 RepID=A0ABQ1FVE8_9BACL|nr:DNA-3-methyladenine glycosylase [Paenibacillus physcomitrellae]GGA29910.1 DNA-3-methyladenine glycosylase [Paenibacillus physcomitrellae]